VTRIPFASPDDVERALDRVVTHLRAGGLVAYPTETVYGFGSLVRDDALNALAALKSRDPAKPFLLLVRGADDMASLIWTESAKKLAGAFWPGPLSLALRVRGDFPSRILAEEGTVAVRATPHAGIRALVQAVGEPITSTSANTPGRPPATNADEVEQVLAGLGNAGVLILDGGQLPPSEPSTLLDCSHEPPRVLRAGAITTEALTRVVKVDD
jgi:L-threonylcarbamoyladenylate synthase